jgi:hypothetical protein
MQRRKLLAWLGPVLAVTGLVTYFTLAVRVPDLRDTAWLNLVMVGVGLAMSIAALVERRNLWRWIGLTLSAMSTVLLASYVFALSSDVPSATLAVPVGVQAPPLVLPDATGDLFSLADGSDQRTLVIFYRGFW